MPPTTTRSRRSAELGFAYDSSHNGAEPRQPDRAATPPDRAGRARGLIEVPVTVIEDAPGSLRHFPALRAVGRRDAMPRSSMPRVEGHAAVTIVSHGFELANRAGTRANGVHVRRFEALCAMLADCARRAADRPFRRSATAAARPRRRAARPRRAAHPLAAGGATLVEHGRGARRVSAL